MQETFIKTWSQVNWKIKDKILSKCFVIARKLAIKNLLISLYHKVFTLLTIPHYKYNYYLMKILKVYK